LSDPHSVLGVSKATSAGWASGTIGSSIMLGAMTLLVLFYLTEYLGIPPAVAGTLIFLSRLWDIGACLLVGQWSDHTQGRWSQRWGRRAPYLMMGAPLAGISFAALFAIPHGLTGMSLNAYVLAALLLFSTGYTLFVVPYLAVPAEITGVPEQRTTMMSYRVVAMTVASMVIAGLGPVLIERFGGGRPGYMGMGFSFATIITAAMAFCAVVVARAPVVTRSKPSQDSFLAQLKIVWRNGPFKIYMGTKFCQLMSTAMVGVSMLYLARYVIGEGEEFLIRFVIYQTAGTMLSLPAWSWIGKRYGKRNSYMGAGLFYALVVLSWVIAALGEPSFVTNTRIFLIGVGLSGILVMGFSILPDTMEHNTKTSGVAQEGTLAGIYSMVEKGTAAFGPLTAGFALEAAGFISAAGGDMPTEQPQSAIVAILLLSSVLPALFNVAGALLLTKFDLEETS
jgi:glycoside/pentoside/hexuronide:cation symporter, GPH family